MLLLWLVMVLFCCGGCGGNSGEVEAVANDVSCEGANHPLPGDKTPRN